MNAIPDVFSVLEFNIDGFIKLSNSQIKNGGYNYLLQKNEVEFNTLWKVSINIEFAILEIKTAYEPTSKLDLTKFATYKACQNYRFEDIQNFKNSNDEIKKVSKSFFKTLSSEYNKLIEGTKVSIPFPTTEQRQLDQFGQHILLSLQKSIEKMKKLPRIQ